ncbi:MAG: N-acetyltransferase [Paenibacillaceae bacterium]|nr:N-acetyltransferase [Paenibacillaceae bacterium]
MQRWDTRRAVPADALGITKLIAHYAAQGLMLPRSLDTVNRQIDTFVVASEDDGSVIGCGSLTQLGADLVEIRSLGVHPEWIGQGIGKRIVGALVDTARARGIGTVMALTYEVAFFERNGFTVVVKDIFPEKVWRDCIHCPKQHNCDEIAVVRRLREEDPHATHNASFQDR